MTSQVSYFLSILFFLASLGCWIAPDHNGQAFAFYLIGLGYNLLGHWQENQEGNRNKK